MKERIILSVPSELVKKVKDLAEKENRNISNMVTVLLEGATKEEKKTA